MHVYPCAQAAMGDALDTPRYMNVIAPRQAFVWGILGSVGQHTGVWTNEGRTCRGRKPFTVCAVWYAIDTYTPEQPLGPSAVACVAPIIAFSAK